MSLCECEKENERTNLDEDVEHGQVPPGVVPDHLLQGAALLGAVLQVGAGVDPLKTYGGILLPDITRTSVTVESKSTHWLIILGPP